jgi:hypothetical protein
MTSTDQKEMMTPDTTIQQEQKTAITKAKIMTIETLNELGYPHGKYYNSIVDCIVYFVLNPTEAYQKQFVKDIYKKYGEQTCNGTGQNFERALIFAFSKLDKNTETYKRIFKTKKVTNSEFLRGISSYIYLQLLKQEQI